MSAIYPLTVMIERMQLQVGSEKPRKYKTLWMSIRTTFTEEGVRGFFRGYSWMLVNMLYFKFLFAFLSSFELKYD